MVICGCWGAAHCRTPFPKGCCPQWAPHKQGQQGLSLPKALSSSTDQTSPCMAAAPLQHLHQNGTEFTTPSTFSTAPLPVWSPVVILCGTAWDTAQRFQLQEATVWSPKKDPKNPTPQTIQKCRLHTLSTTSTFIGNILPIQYGNGDTCFHEAVLVLESTQRATFHQEDGIVLDCLN